MFRRRHPRRPFFPFWIFFLLFFLAAGKGSFIAWLFPLILLGIFGPMLWSLSSGGRKWTQDRNWEPTRNPIPPQWQTPQPPQPARSTVTRTDSQPTRSTVGLPTTCPACGGPVNPTTLEWRTNTPHCGYCGTNLK